MYILLLNITSSTCCMFYFFNQAIEKVTQKKSNKDTEEENTSSKADNNDIPVKKSNIVAKNNFGISEIFNSIQPQHKEHLFVIASTTATALLLMYFKKEEISQTKKGVQNGIKACQKQWVNHKNKKDAKKRLTHIALDYKNFNSVTVQDLEEIFLPHNLNWINDFYESGVCVCYGKKKNKEKNSDCFECVLDAWFIKRKDTIILPATTTRDTKILYKPAWTKPNEHAQEYPVLFFEDTLLTIACRAGNFDVCTWLLKHGADPNLRGKKKGLSYIFGDAPLFASLHNKTPQQIRLYLELLFSYGANPNVFSYIQAVSKDFVSYTQTVYKHYTGKEIKKSDFLTMLWHVKTECSTFSYEIFKDFACGCIENEDPTFCNHSASCDNMKMLIRHGMLVKNSEIFRLLISGFYQYPFSQMSESLAKKIIFNPVLWERVLFDGFDPNQEDIVWAIACNVNYGVGQINQAYCFDKLFGTNESEEKYGLLNKYVNLLQLFLRYGRRVQLRSGEITLNDWEKKDIEEGKYILLSNKFTPLLQEEYEFRKAFLHNPQQLFLDLMKRCKRPELWIERLTGDMDVSQGEQNKLIKDVCLQSLLLFNNILKGQRNEFFLPDLSKTVCYVLDDVHQKKLINCDDEIKTTTTNIMLDSLYTLYELQGLEKLVEEGDDRLQKLKEDEIKYKNNAFPFINFCSKNHSYVHWLQTKNNMNMFHILAYGIDNNLLKNMLDNLKTYDIFFLEKVLNEPMQSSKFSNDTYTTPLYIAQQQSNESKLSKEAACLFLAAENEIRSKYGEFINSK